jgi:hypothetical protein
VALALCWIAFGVAVAIGAWRMDRLAHLNIEPWSAPGLVPGVLGVLIAAFGAVLAWREAERRRARPGARGDAPPAGAGSAAAADAATGAATGAEAEALAPGAAGDEPVLAALRRVAPVLAIALAFAVGLLGRGLPFAATSSLLVFAWIVLLRWPEWRAQRGLPRGLATAAVVAVASCTLIALLFQEVFLVRLP